jgi:hypothetical protein
MSLAKYLLMIFLLFAWIDLRAQTASHLEPYRTDSCSAPAGLSAASWTECCVSHDFAYWVGGSSKEKQRADSQLINCLRSKGVGGELAAKIFELAPKRLSQSHWGNRWHPPRPDRPLSEAELDQVKKYQTLFSLPNPIVENAAGKVCDRKIREKIARLTHLPARQRLNCFDLVNSDSRSPATEELVYSPSCLGYFVIQKIQSPQEFEHVTGYGECAKFLRHPTREKNPRFDTSCLMAEPRLSDFYDLMKALNGQKAN